MPDSKLCTLVREVVRQRKVLEGALDHDDIAVQLMLQERDGRRNRTPGTGHRRIWTRRDKRLFEASDDGGVPPIRTERLLERFYPRVGECSVVSLLNAAIGEAKGAGRFEVLIDQITTVSAAHLGLLHFVADCVDQVDSVTTFDQVKAFHNSALDQLAEVAPEIKGILRTPGANDV